MREWIARRGFETLYIEPGSLWQNACSETFKSRLRDDPLNIGSFGSLQEASVLAKAYRQVYNEDQFHSSLDYQTPVEFARRCLLADSATLHQPNDNAIPPRHALALNHTESTYTLSSDVDQRPGARQCLST